LLPALQPTAGRHGIVGCVLSGAGPSVLVLSQPAAAATAEAAMREAMRTAGVEAELLKAQVVPQGPGVSWPEFSLR
jgi:homoserine kinase